MLNSGISYWRDDHASNASDEHTQAKSGITQDRKRPWQPLEWLYASFALAPALAFATVWAFSWRVSMIIGRWPLVMHDDPKFAAPGDILSTILQYAVFGWLVWSFVGCLMLPVLTVMLRRVYSPFRLIFMLLVFVLMFALIRLDPGLRFMWFMD